MKIIKQESLWPTPLWHSNIYEYINNQEIINWVLNKTQSEKSIIKSNRGGWQSELVQSENILQSLIKEIKIFCKQLPLDIKEVEMSQMWINVNTKGNWNLIHQHGGGYDLSGIYYLKVPEESGAIVFRDPRPGSISSVFLNTRFNKGEFRNFNIEEGRLMIWPPYLDHYVEPSNTDETRISISFDIKCC